MENIDFGFGLSSEPARRIIRLKLRVLNIWGVWFDLSTPSVLGWRFYANVRIG
ncbi:MAG: hypothetical protein ACXABY_24725 [Candidatus Thorarchaeota archaeon]|jgi:hypothetical protein